MTSNKVAKIGALMTVGSILHLVARIGSAEPKNFATIIEINKLKELEAPTTISLTYN